MNICYLSGTYHPTIGGAETYIKTLAEGMAKKFNNVYLLTDEVKGEKKEEKINNVNVYRCTEYQNLINRNDKVRWEQMYFSLLTDCYEYLRDKKIDIIHANSFETAILGTFISRSLNVPLVCTFHEVFPEEDPYGIGKCKVVFQNENIDCFVASSNFYYDKAISFEVDIEKLKLIYHGIEIDKFKGNNHNQLYKKNDEFLLLCVARIKERKGIKELILAMSELIKEYPYLKLIICGTVNSGSEDYYKNLLNLIDKLNLNRCISIRDDFSYEDMPKVYQEADIVIQPSYYEGLGLAILEAMANKKTIIASNTSGIKEIIVDRKNGLLVKTKDVMSLVETIKLAIENPLLRRDLSNASYKTICNRFNIERTISQTIDIYKCLINKNSEVLVNGR